MRPDDARPEESGPAYYADDRGRLYHYDDEGRRHYEEAEPRTAVVGPGRDPEHYCQGGWVKGIRARCPEKVHNLKLKRDRRPT